MQEKRVSALSSHVQECIHYSQNQMYQLVHPMFVQESLPVIVPTHTHTHTHTQEKNRTNVLIRIRLIRMLDVSHESGTHNTRITIFPITIILFGIIPHW